MLRSRATLVLSAVLLVSGSGCGTSPRAPAPAEAAALRDRLDTYLRTRAEAGYSGVVLVSRDGEVVLREAYSPDGALTPASAFWIGSVSKTITAAAVLRLRDEGRLALADSLPRFFDAVPADKRGVTVRHLLTHTSGLGDLYTADGVADRDAALRAILARPLERAPGEAYGYSVDGYVLLAALLEVAAGEPFEAVVRDRVLGPAGMTETGFWGEPPPGGALAAAGASSAPDPNWGYRGPTGLSSTVDDLHRWHLALLGDAVLPAATRTEAFAPQARRPNGNAYGYGWHILRTSRGTSLLAHNVAEDEVDHYAALYRFVDEGIAVVALSNGSEDDAVATVRGVLGVLFPE